MISQELFRPASDPFIPYNSHNYVLPHIHYRSPTCPMFSLYFTSRLNLVETKIPCLSGAYTSLLALASFPIAKGYWSGPISALYQPYIFITFALFKYLYNIMHMRNVNFK